MDEVVLICAKNEDIPKNYVGKKIYTEGTIYKEIFIHRVQCREYYK